MNSEVPVLSACDKRRSRHLQLGVCVQISSLFTEMEGYRYSRLIVTKFQSTGIRLRSVSSCQIAKTLLIFLIRLNSPYLSVKIKARPSKQDVNKQKRFAFKLSDIDNAKLL